MSQSDGYTIIVANISTLEPGEIIKCAKISPSNNSYIKFDHIEREGSTFFVVASELVNADGSALNRPDDAILKFSVADYFFYRKYKQTGGRRRRRRSSKKRRTKTIIGSIC
jgi:hypothetical protein